MNYLDAFRTVNNLDGNLVELGFGKGNSLKEFISFMNGGDIDKREIYIYESFEGYNNPSPEDKDAFKKGGFKRPIQPAYDIRHTINKEVFLIKGYIEDTLPSQAPSTPIAIIHSHLISYTSTQHGLNILSPKLKDNGIFVITDYDIFPGTQQAVDEFIAKYPKQWQLTKCNGFVVIKKIKIEEVSNKVSRTRTPLV